MLEAVIQEQQESLKSLNDKLQETEKQILQIKSGFKKVEDLPEPELPMVSQRSMFEDPELRLKLSEAECKIAELEFEVDKLRLEMDEANDENVKLT